MKEYRGKQLAGLVAGLTSEDATSCQEILERLKCASGANSDADLADKLGLKRSSISTAKTRKMIPSSWIVNTANLFKISADSLIFGEKSTHAAPLAGKQVAEASENQHIISIPLVEAELAAGGGSFIDSKFIIKHIEINIELIKYKGPMKDLVFMSVQGDSMTPTIAHQDLVLINLSQTTPYSGGVFAVAHDYGIYVKRLITEPGKLILRSDNRYYNDIVIDLRDEATMSLVKIIGRAVWWCHDERT
jgi:phage repressor protein C with HTH and peptisase S24 domain